MTNKINVHSTCTALIQVQVYQALGQEQPVSAPQPLPLSLFLFLIPQTFFISHSLRLKILKNSFEFSLYTNNRQWIFSFYPFFHLSLGLKYHEYVMANYFKIQIDVVILVHSSSHGSHSFVPYKPADQSSTGDTDCHWGTREKCGSKSRKLLILKFKTLEVILKVPDPHA